MKLKEKIEKLISESKTEKQIAEELNITIKQLQALKSKLGLTKKQVKFTEDTSQFMVIKDYPDYRINRDGIVINSDSLILRPVLRNGYPSVMLYKESKAKREVVHCLVAIQFIPNPNNYPIINHIDGNKQNPNFGNLEWCTPQQNSRHAVDTGLFVLPAGVSHPNSKLSDDDVVDICKLINSGFTPSEIIEVMNLTVTTSTVNQIKFKKTWTHISSKYLK